MHDGYLCAYILHLLTTDKYEHSGTYILWVGWRVSAGLDIGFPAAVLIQLPCTAVKLSDS